MGNPSFAISTEREKAHIPGEASHQPCLSYVHSHCRGDGRSYWPGVRLLAHSHGQSTVQGNYK